MTHAAGTARSTEVLIVTEHRLFADALRHLVRARHPNDTVTAARPGAELDRMGAMLRPDVILLDVQVGQATATRRRLMCWYPDAVILCIAADGGDDDARDASGPVLRARTIDQLVDAVCEVIAGRRSGRHGSAEHGDRLPRSAPPTVLSAREREIVALLDQGFANKQIAARLGITVATAKNHVHHILGKLAVKTRGQAAACVRDGAPATAEQRARFVP